MKILARFALTIGAATLFAGCAGSQPIGAYADRGGSSIRPETKNKDLLYVSDSYSNDVYLFALPSGNLVGTLTGFKSPQSLCVDKAGDVFIPDSGASDIVEYAHGGSEPIKTLEDTDSPTGCSVDPTTGNLAVSNFSQFVSVYPSASGSPTNYSTTFPAAFAAYDDNGDLFVSGPISKSGLYTIAAAELPSGGQTVENISLDKPLGYFAAAGLQWVGGDLVIAHAGPPQYGCCGRVYRFKIKGTSGTHAGSYLAHTDLADFFVYGSTIVTTNGSNALWLYDYPIKSGPVQRISYPAAGAFGVVVSEAGSR
jgi:hypothetical protein